MSGGANAASGTRGYKWRGKGAKDSDEDESDGESDPEMAGMSELERQRAKYLKRKRETAGLTREQRQKATMQKLKGFQKSLASGDGDPEIRAHSLKFERERREAESASVYDSFDPLKHGTDDERARNKIKEREKTMLSMKREGGTFDTSGWDD